MKRCTVGDVMTRDVVTVTEDTPFAEIADTLLEHDIAAVPVVDDDAHVVGIITEADLLRKEEYKRGDDEPWPFLEGLRDRRARAKAAATDARGLMSKPVVTVRPDVTVAETARLLARHKFKEAPVVDENDRLTGIVARSDLLLVFNRSDDAIRDEIIQEVLVCGLWQDPSEVQVQVREGVVRLYGRMELKSLIPVVVRMTAATEGVVDVIDDLTYVHDDTHPTAFPRP